jgi:glutaminase
MPMPAFLQSIIDWLRAGYPEGVPSTDYIPLIALLGSQLTELEIMQIADELAKEGDPDSAATIKKIISDVTRTKATDADVNRVRARLAEGGWPLAPVEPSAAERAGGQP